VKAGANGLPDAPLDVQLQAAGLALRAARREAEAFCERRAEAGRDMSVKAWGAMDELAMESGETMLAILSAEAKAGQAVAGARKRFVADMMRALTAFIGSLPEDERGQVEALLRESDGGGKSGLPDDAEALELALLAGEFPGLMES
jgi:ribosomal 50S subunit-associated protein YjgA (DUF615 family)